MWKEFHSSTGHCAAVRGFLCFALLGEAPFCDSTGLWKDFELHRHLEKYESSRFRGDLHTNEEFLRCLAID